MKLRFLPVASALLAVAAIGGTDRRIRAVGP